MKSSNAVLLLLSLSSPMPVVAQVPPSLDVIRQRDLAAQAQLLMKWWPGQYDNHEQIVRQSGGGLSKPLETPFRRVHTVVRPITVPTLGKNILSVVQYGGPDQSSVLKSELLIIVSDPKAQALRATRYSVDPSRLADSGTTSLTMKDLAPLSADCDLLIKFAGSQFDGRLASGSCKDKGGVANYQFLLGENQMWERAEARTPRTRALVWEMAPGTGFDWYQQTRARPFTCNIFENADGIMAKTAYLKTIHLHDQGGASDIEWPDGRTLTFTIHTRAFSSTPDRQYPLFRIHEKGNPVPIAYAYSVDQTKRFGLNLGWFYIRCYEDGDIAPLDMLEAVRR